MCRLRSEEGNPTFPRIERGDLGDGNSIRVKHEVYGVQLQSKGGCQGRQGAKRAADPRKLCVQFELDRPAETPRKVLRVPLIFTPRK
jgi:hypothetical protein